MKVFFAKIGQWLVDNHDAIDDLKAIGKPLSLLLLGWLPTLNMLNDYNINPDFGFFAIFGQLLGYIARYKLPYLFPKAPNLNLGKWWIMFVGDMVFAWTFGIFMTPIAFKYFDDKTLSIAGVAVLVGMFYDLILIPLIIVAYQASAWLRKKWGSNFTIDEQLTDKQE